MGMQFFFFDSDEKIIGILKSAETCQVDEAAYTADLEFVANVPFDWSECFYVAFEDIDGFLTLWEIKTYKGSSANGLATVKLSAESTAMAELLDEVITGKAVSGAQAGYATQRVLEDTRWIMKSSETTERTVTSLFYYTNAWKALDTIREATGCAHYFGITVSGGIITERYVRVKARAGASRGRIFDTGKDMTAFEITEDRTGVYTRLYGRGKGEEVGQTASGETTYGRRLTFEDVVWSTEDGDPVDKPLGQLYVEDVAATARFGRGPAGNKRPRQNIVTFEDCEDPEELLEMTWEKLKSVRYPVLRITGTFVDMEQVWGYTHEAVRRGDDVQVLVREWDIAYQDYVENVIRDYVNPLNTKVVIGPEGQTSYSIQSELSTTVEKVREKADIGSSLAAANPDLMQGIINTMVTSIMSSGTGISTDPNDGSLLLTSNDGSTIVKVTGSGILIANSKTGNAWNWRTAINGNGIVTSELTAGVIYANLIKILGTDRFYWDASNIYIHDPNHLDNQIRIGQYDGVHYGIAFTQDGGLTWQTAIDFDGVHAEAGSGYQVYIGTEAPENTNVYKVWLDTSQAPAIFMRYNEESASWETTTADVDYTAELSELQTSLEDYADAAVEAYATPTAEFETFKQTVKTILDMNDDGTTMIFQGIEQAIADSDVSNTDYYKNLMAYIRFGLDGISIGKSDSAMSMRLDNGNLNFYTNGVLSAYFSGEDNKLYILDGEFMRSIKIGNYSWILETDGSLSLTYEGSGT